MFRNCLNNLFHNPAASPLTGFISNLEFVCRILLALEQKETITHNKVRISELLSELEQEKSQTKSYQEELDAYKVGQV